MVRSRVRSFISAFGAPKSTHGSNTPDSGTTTPTSNHPSRNDLTDLALPRNASRTALSTADRGATSRPTSMAFTSFSGQAEPDPDTVPELLPVFSFLNSHANKLYQEGYFLKLNDLDTQGRPCGDRRWVESFAQLVGTVLSVWDAAALDAAGQDKEVLPTFINLADASLKMIETLPTRDANAQPLHNVLSISTAGKNRYLFHFNSFHSLVQWTASIRLSLFEHTSLLEAYTGSMIAGKGRDLNNIRTIMERCRFKHEDWARVRFGAGTPWRRCWCVVTPPDEKEVQKLQKSMKKRSAYDRTSPVLTGNVQFFDTKKTKKAQPIATISNAYAAYAIYPQSKALIDQSTLVKIDGQITIHSQTQSTTEGFVFVMPELHPAVSGFEIMLRFLFPVFDTFGLYGRPTRLIADTNNVKSLMFAFPKHKQYGFLDVLDVVNLINTSGSQAWTESEWKKQLRAATAQRMASSDSPRDSVMSDERPRQRSSLPVRQNVTRFAEPNKPYGSEFNQSADAVIESTGQHAVPASLTPLQPASHVRSASDSSLLGGVKGAPKPLVPSRLSTQNTPPESPIEGISASLEGRSDSRPSSGSESDTDLSPSETSHAERVQHDLYPN